MPLLRQKPSLQSRSLFHDIHCPLAGHHNSFRPFQLVVFTHNSNNLSIGLHHAHFLDPCRFIHQLFNHCWVGSNFGEKSFLGGESNLMC